MHAAIRDAMNETLKLMTELLAAGWEVSLVGLPGGRVSLQIWADGRGCHRYEGTLDVVTARAWAGERGDA